MTNDRSIPRRALLLAASAFLLAAQLAHAQSNILGPNLIVNGNAEAGPAGTSITNVVSNFSGWTRTGNVNVLSYNLTGLLQTTEPSPPDHGFQYFVGGPVTLGRTGSLTQDIDVSSAAATINRGKVKYAVSAYLGSVQGGGLAPP